MTLHSNEGYKNRTDTLINPFMPNGIPALIYWMHSFQNQMLLSSNLQSHSNSNSSFCKRPMQNLIICRILWQLIWFCTDCQCPIKWALRLIWVNASIFSLDKQNFSAQNCKYFLTHTFTICFVCSKEPSHCDGSFEYPQHMFWLRNKKIIFLSHTLNYGLVTNLLQKRDIVKRKD